MPPIEKFCSYGPVVTYRLSVDRELSRGLLDAWWLCKPMDTVLRFCWLVYRTYCDTNENTYI